MNGSWFDSWGGSWGLSWATRPLVVVPGAVCVTAGVTAAVEVNAELFAEVSVGAKAHNCC